MSIETYMSAVQSWLSKQKERGCEIPVYVSHGACPREVYLNYDVMDMLRGGIITSKGGSGWARGRADDGEGPADATLRTYDLSGWPEAPEVYPLVVTRRTIAEEEALNDIEFCNAPTCLGPCGVTEDVCTDGIITANFTTVGETDVWYTTNGWVAGAACNAPFGAIDDEIATAAVCFYIDRDTVRHIVGRGTVSAVAAPAEIGYTDDLGAGCTWAQVNVGTTNGEFFQYGGSIWAHNGRNIWGGTNTGSIYFSSDEGLTWTDQASPLASAIYSIHFVDENYGMAVGAANVFAYTTDGGEHWTAGTGPNAAVILTGVRVVDNNRAWICCADGDLYYTNDFGANWTQRTLPTTPTALGAIDLLDEYVIATVGHLDVSATDYPIIFRSFNGGFSWETFQYGTAFDSGVTYGLNAVKICSYNHLFAVGEELGATGVILELENAQPS
jgi:photosystem II stability/assembly factor-like uncharacterized protein